VKIVPLVSVLLVAVAAAFAQTPAISNGGIVNGASFAGGQPIAPGSLIAIFGSNLGSTLALADTVPLSTSMANVSVSINNTPARMYSIVPNDHLNVQVPWSVSASGTAQVVVTRSGTASAPASVQMAAIAPGIFSYVDGAANVLRAIAYNNSDQTFAWPTGAVAVPSRPVKIGDPTTLVILCTGLGPAHITPADGAPPPATASTADLTLNTAPQVLVGGVPAQVVFAGLSPQFVGVNQLNVVLAPGTPTGNTVSLQIVSGGITTSDQVKIAVTQ
jgi:uncharacterized protein (TIGR03437 family)